MAIHTYLSTNESKKNKGTSRTETDMNTETILTVVRWEGDKGDG